MLKFARLGAVGLHPSLLPRYRGSWPLWWALRNGEPEVGLTLYRLTEDVDGGPILGQSRVAVLPGDTFASLYGRVAATTPGLLASMLDEIGSSGRLPDGMPQDRAQATWVRTPGRFDRAVFRARRAIAARTR